MTNSPVAVVTGASRGLGLALARGLAAAGYSLIIDGRDEAALDRAAAGLRAVAGSAGGTIVALAGDIADPVHRTVLRAAAARLGGATLLVNNAGTLGASPLPALADYPVDQLRDGLRGQRDRPDRLTQLLLPDVRRRAGAVLCVTSDAAVEPYAGWGGYGAAKAALEQACPRAGRRGNRRPVWRVDPGDLRTQMHQAAFPGEDISDRPLPESVVPAFLRLIAERLPSGRYQAAELMRAEPRRPARPPGPGQAVPEEARS